MKKFLIVSQSRTGGTHLTSTLHAQRNIRCVSEPYPHLKLVTHSDQILWSKMFYEESDASGLRAAGFRTKVKQLSDPEEFANFLNEQNIKVFYLRRDNKVKQAISSIRAIELFKRSGDFNVKGNASPLPPTVIPLGALKHHLRDIEAQSEQETAFFNVLPPSIKANLTELRYEDMLENSGMFFGRVFSQLEVPLPATLPTNIKKNTSDDLHEAVSNYEELCSWLVTTPYSQFV
jgi:LPS sulfotransferase NodH